MKKKKSLLILLVVVISIGFALVTARMGIFGKAKFNITDYDIYFANLKITKDSENAIRPKISDYTTITYGIMLDGPDDDFEFTVDVINSGEIDAVTSNIIKTPLSPEQEEYLVWTVTYDDGSDISVDDVIEAGTSVTYKFYIGYKKDEMTVEDLPLEGTEMTDYSFRVEYEAAN